jgi:hypothetical protein
MENLIELPSDADLEAAADMSLPPNAFSPSKAEKSCK